MNAVRADSEAVPRLFRWFLRERHDTGITCAGVPRLLAQLRVTDSAW